MFSVRTVEEVRLERLPGAVCLSTAILLIAGAVASLIWWRTGDQTWLRSFFSYPGALFFVGCSLVQAWLSFRCWQEFSPGDLLRPAWLLIALSAMSQLTGGVVSWILGLESRLNPLSLLSAEWAHALTRVASQAGPLFPPLSMAFLACGLWRVLQACRRNGILGTLKPTDLFLLGLVVVYTAYFLVTVVFAPDHGGRPMNAGTFISWTSDPLLCVLLSEAILIRRSTANMGFGLISRCWLAFTVAIFLTSLGDVGIWAQSRGYLPYPLVVTSWYIWFLPSAAYAIGPAYQLLAMLRAKRGDIGLAVEQSLTVATR